LGLRITETSLDDVLPRMVHHLSMSRQEDLVLKTEKMKQLIRACELGLKEMEHFATYRQDEKR
jgi:hypothetical protein